MSKRSNKKDWGDTPWKPAKFDAKPSEIYGPKYIDFSMVSMPADAARSYHCPDCHEMYSEHLGAAKKCVYGPGYYSGYLPPAPYIEPGPIFNEADLLGPKDA